MSQTLQDRLDSLEKTIFQLKKDQEQYSALKALAESAPNLLNVDSLLRSYKKKAKQLLQSLNTNKSIIKEIKNSLSTYDSRVKNQVEAAAQKRDKKTKFLENKVYTLENSFKQLTIDNESTMTSLEVKIKDEVQAGVAHIDSQLEGHIKDTNRKIRENKEETQKYSKRLINEAEEIAYSLTQFDFERGEFIQKMLLKGRGNDPSKIDGRKNLSNWLLEEANSKLHKRISSIQSSYEARFKALNLKYNQELLSIRADIEEARESKNKTINKGKKPEAQLESNIESIRTLLNNVAAFSSTSISGINDTISSFSIDDSTCNELNEYKGNVSELKETIEKTETKLNADFFNIDEMLRKAVVLSKTIQNKKSVTRIRNLEKEAQMCKTGIKSRLADLKGNLDTFETKIYLAIKQNSYVEPSQVVVEPQPTENEEVKDE